MRKNNWVMKIFTDQSGEPSSMRITLFVITILICMILYAIYNYIGAAINGKLTVDWVGLSAFTGALTTLIGVVVFQKVKQKQFENNDNNSAQ